MIPLLPLYAEKYHPSPVAFGLLMSSYSAMQFLCAPILGRLSDRFGRRPVLLFSLAGTVVGYLLFAFARSLPVLFASRLLDGATGGNIGTAHAVIADTTSPEERARGMGLVGMAFGLGFIFGPAIAGFTVGSRPERPRPRGGVALVRRVRLGLPQAARDAPRRRTRRARSPSSRSRRSRARSAGRRSAPSCFSRS